MIYYFYSNTDPKAEPINQVEAECWEDACDYFAGRKQLTLQQFFNLYEVTVKLT